MTRIKTKIKSLIQDNAKLKNELFEYSGYNIFTLTEPNILEVINVTIDGAELESGESFDFDVDTNTVTVNATLTSDQIVTIYYTYVCYSDTELNDFIQSALIHLSINKYYKNSEAYRIEELSGGDKVIYPKVNDKDENLIAFIASILIKPNYESYRLPTLSVTYPKTVCKDEKITRLINRFKSSVGISGAIQL
ncbi:MAG: hypothetical protein JW924_03370 [Fusobacteriaceae bacterium]|nr:hypothetical protein [Fusobacteriaceae bacterium]